MLRVMAPVTRVKVLADGAMYWNHASKEYEVWIRGRKRPATTEEIKQVFRPVK